MLLSLAEGCLRGVIMLPIILVEHHVCLDLRIWTVDIVQTKTVVLMETYINLSMNQLIESVSLHHLNF